MRALATAAVACMHGRYVGRFNGNTQCRRARPRVNSKRVSFAASSGGLWNALIDGTGVFQYTAESCSGNYSCSCFAVVPAPPGKKPPSPSEVHSLLFSGPGMSFFWDSRISAYLFSPPVKITTRWMRWPAAV